jgi:hypothetical protein
MCSACLLRRKKTIRIDGDYQRDLNAGPVPIAVRRTRVSTLPALPHSPRRRSRAATRPTRPLRAMADTIETYRENYAALLFSSLCFGPSSPYRAPSKRWRSRLSSRRRRVCRVDRAVDFPALDAVAPDAPRRRRARLLGLHGRRDHDVVLRGTSTRASTTGWC